MKSMLLFAAMVLIASPALAHRQERVLVKGQSETIALDYEAGDVAVADPSVCDFLVGRDRRSIYINARGGGQTSIAVWDSAGAARDEISVRVVTTTLKETLDRVRESIGSLKGVAVDLIDGRVEISGSVADPAEFRAIDSLSRADPRVRSRVRITPDVMEEVARSVRSALDVPGVGVRAVRDRIVLEGAAHSAADAKRAVEIARLYTDDAMDLIEVRESGRRVGRGTHIELDFHLMEIKRQALREIAFNWAPGSFPGGAGGVGAGAAAGDLGRAVLGFVANFVPKLKLIRERGQGRVLENPSIVVKSGEEARIFSGSEVPFIRGEDVQFKKVGVEILASPVEVKGGVDIKLSATLSAPSADIRGAVDTHTVSTTAVCPVGQSVVLGGIVRNNDVKMRNRAPRGMDTSTALMTLFLSKDFQSNRSEFVIVVTPRLVERPSSAESRLMDFLATEEMMIRDRSRKEHEDYLRGESRPAEGEKRRRNRRAKW